MKAMYIREPGQIEFTDMEKSARKKGKVLLKLLHGGIHGSDLGSYKRTFVYSDYPRIPDREFSTEIVGANEDSEQGLCPGMIITCNPYFNCGHCYSCRNRVVSACMDNQTTRCQCDGTFQEYIAMPSERVYDGEGVNPMLLAVIEPFCISYHGISRTEVGTGGKVFVIGVGTIRVLAAVAAEAKGMLVYISDASEGKLEMTKAFGVDGIVLNDFPENFEKAVNDITEGNGFDTAIEAAGSPSTFQNCIDAACFGGKVVVIGTGKKNPDFDFILLQKKELNIFSSRNALEKDFIELTDLVKSRETPIENTITNIYKLENRAKAFYDFTHNPGGMLKVIIDLTGN